MDVPPVRVPRQHDQGVLTLRSESKDAGTMKYRVRVITPKRTEWCEVEGESPFDAAQNHHMDLDDREAVKSILYERVIENDGREVLKFIVVEVEGHGEGVSRLIEIGIRRKGVRKPLRPLSVLAEELGWKHPIKQLLEDWTGEESWDTARERRDNKYKKHHRVLTPAS